MKRFKVGEKLSQVLVEVILATQEAEIRRIAVRN
jgi:hypothetical protein